MPLVSRSCVFEAMAIKEICQSGTKDFPAFFTATSWCFFAQINWLYWNSILILSLSFFGHSRRLSLFLCLRFLLISKADMTAIISQQQMVLFSYSATTRNEPSTTGRLRFFLLSTRYNKRCLISDETFDLMFFFLRFYCQAFAVFFGEKNFN